MFKITKTLELDRYIGFIIDNEFYCINVEHVQELIYVPMISKIPSSPQYIEGAINLRGKIVKVFNLRKWFRLPWKAIDRSSQIVIVDVNDSTFGILVDSIYEVFRCDNDQKNEIPYLISKQSEISYAKSIIDENGHLFIEIKPEIFLNSN